MDERGFSNSYNSHSSYRQARPPLSAIDRFLSNRSHLVQPHGVLENEGLQGFSTVVGAVGGGDFGSAWTNHDIVQEESLLDFDGIFGDHGLDIELSANNRTVLEERNQNVIEKYSCNNKEILGKRAKKVSCSSSSSCMPNMTLVKGQWTDEEDGKLIRLVKQYGVRKWAQIAEKMTGRAGKQCRERWHNHLRPDIKKDSWSEEEERILVEAHAEVGNKWAEIAKRIVGRTENSIKNHWNATKRRQNSRRSKSTTAAKHYHKHQTHNHLFNKNTNHHNNKSSAPPKPPQSSVLQNYIKSKTLLNNNNNNSTTSSTVTEDKNSNAYHNNPTSEYSSNNSVVDEEPPLVVPPTYDDELLFMQSLFTTNSVNKVPSLVDHRGNDTNVIGEYNSSDHHDQAVKVNNHDLGGSNTTSETNAVVSEPNSSRTYLHSDLYLSYLLNGGPTSSHNQDSSSVFYDCNGDNHSMDLVAQSDGQCFSTSSSGGAGKREMDLIEMVASCFYSHN